MKEITKIVLLLALVIALAVGGRMYDYLDSHQTPDVNCVVFGGVEHINKIYRGTTTGIVSICKCKGSNGLVYNISREDILYTGSTVVIGGTNIKTEVFFTTLVTWVFVSGILWLLVQVFHYLTNYKHDI